MKIVASIIFIILVPAITHALSEDKNMPVTISADRAILDRKNGIGTYISNVIITQGTSNLESNMAFTYLDNQDKLDKAIAQGDLINQAHFWTIPKSNKSFIHGFANKIEFYPKLDKIIMIGDAYLLKDSNIYKAPILEYDLKQKYLQSPSQANGKTVLLIDPK